MTGGLAGAGAIVGAICGAGIIALWMVIEGGITGLFSADNARVFSFAGLFGAVVGSVAAPALSWGILRRVPLGRAILATSIGGFVVGGIMARLTMSRRVASGAPQDRLTSSDDGGIA